MRKVPGVTLMDLEREQVAPAARHKNFDCSTPGLTDRPYMLAKWSISQLMVRLDSKPHAGYVSLFNRCLRHEFVFGFQFCKTLEQSSTVELPVKWARLSIA